VGLIPIDSIQLWTVCSKMYGLATCIKDGWMAGGAGGLGFIVGPPRGDTSLVTRSMVALGAAMLLDGW
jgi:hypothetical protein